MRDQGFEFHFESSPNLLFFLLSDCVAPSVVEGSEGGAKGLLLGRLQRVVLSGENYRVKWTRFYRGGAVFSNRARPMELKKRVCFSQRIRRAVVELD